MCCNNVINVVKSDNELFATFKISLTTYLTLYTVNTEQLLFKNLLQILGHQNFLEIVSTKILLKFYYKILKLQCLLNTLYWLICLCVCEMLHVGM